GGAAGFAFLRRASSRSVRWAGERDDRREERSVLISLPPPSRGRASPRPLRETALRSRAAGGPALRDPPRPSPRSPRELGGLRAAGAPPRPRARPRWALRAGSASADRRSAPARCG